MNLNISKRLILGFLVATAILVVAVSLSIWKVSEINTISNRIAHLRTPTAQHSATMLSHINASMADLRGYMLTGDQKFKTGRAKIWADIEQTRSKMDELSSGWTDSANIEKWNDFKIILEELMLAQTQVENVANTEAELPATKILVGQAAPLAAILMNSITEIINLERELPANAARKELLGVMADTRGFTASGLANIRAFLLTGNLRFRQNFDENWRVNTNSFELLQQNQTLFTPEQLVLFKKFSDTRAKFTPLPEEMFSIRVSEKWNMASYLLVTETAPRADRLLDMLLGIPGADGERIGGMTRSQQQLLDIDGLRNSQAVSALLMAEWALLVIGVGMTIAIAFFVTRSIVSPINAMTDAMKRISAGEMDVEIPALQNTDEIGTMAKAVEIFKATAIEMRRLVEDELNFQKHALDEHSIVSIADVRGDITYVNDKFCAISGYSREELIRNNHRIVKSDEHPKEFFVDIWKTIARGDTWQGEIKNISKSGDYYWVKTTIVPNLNEDGKPYQYVGIRTEITKDKIREQELLELSEDLTRAKEASEKANAIKSEFLAAMSHEIRTPMAGIIGMSDLILERKLEPQVKDWTKTIRSSSDHLMKILNEILDQSKLDVGKISIDPVDFHFASAVNSTANLFLPKIATKGLTLDIDIDETIPDSVHSDPTRITQVLSNFLSNALKFTAKGSISIIIEHEPTKDSEFKLRFSILDTGIGISKTAQTKLFIPFTQADNSTSRTYGGTGLGLSISKQLVELMGGEVGVSSVEGIGSKFWFTVLCSPAQKNVAPVNMEIAKETWHASRRLKILVAEDTGFIQEIIAATLAQLNHDAIIVDNGKKAVEAHETGDFDLILMDIRMPVMDGIEATGIIRKMEQEKAGIPIIALTADISSGNIKDYRTAGMSAVCAKPINVRELLKEINSLLDEEIHTVIPNAQPIQVGGQALNGGSNPAPKALLISDNSPGPGTSFQKVLDQASSLIEQLPDRNQDISSLIPRTGGITAESFAAMQKKYEKSLTEECGKLKSVIEQLRESPVNAELRDAASMLAHSMKGAGGTFNYELVTTIAAETDKILSSDAALELEHFLVLDNLTLALSLIADQKITGDGGEAGRTILHGLAITP